MVRIGMTNTQLEDNTEIDGEVRLEPHTIDLVTVAEQEEVLGASVHFEATIITRDTLDGLFDAFASDTNRHRMVDLASVLGSIMFTGIKKEKFFPRNVWIRDCMKTIFKRFAKDSLEFGSKRVLIGSPGVGKSVLFFIAAMYKALHGTYPVIYVRITEEDDISAFGMFRTANGLKIYSCREIEKIEISIESQSVIPRAIIAVQKCFNLRINKNCWGFLDGPRHDAHSFLKSLYTCFCTSAGHPLPKNEELSFYIWLLNGWSKQEVIDFSEATGRDEYLDAYAKFGGCIRDMNSYVNGDEEMKTHLLKRFRELTARVGQSQIDLCLTTSRRSNDDDGGNPDRLRMMFNGDEHPTIPSTVQIIDSMYALRLLRGRYSMEPLHRALKQGKVIKSGTVSGIYFEEMLHQWFKATLPNGVTGFIEPQGSGAEGVRALKKEGHYWIPSIPNFANTDAAVVINKKLYVFQYTKSNRHAFNEDTFWQSFAAVVFYQVRFTAIHVYVVGMDDVRPELTVNFERELPASLPSPVSTRDTPRVKIQCTSSVVSINTTTVETFQNSAKTAFVFTRKRKYRPRRNN